MRMSRASAYALSAVLQLADTPANMPVPCSRLAKKGEMPERFLLQVLRNLVNHGVLKSTRGVDGGYALQRPLEELSLLHIFEAADGPLTPIIPPLDSLPELSRAKLSEVLQATARQTCQQLAAVKLVELLPTTEGQPAAVSE